MTLHLGSRRELFVDDFFIQSLDHVSLKMHAPTEREIALPANGEQYAYITVLTAGDEFRMYYRGINMGKLNQFTHLATSRDGIHWDKPALGLIAHQGSKQNNIMWDAGGLIPLTPNGIAATPGEIDKAFALMRTREARKHAARIDEQEKTNSDTATLTQDNASPQEIALADALVQYTHGGLPSTTHNFTPFVDTNPDCPTDQRYKAVGGSGPAGLYAMASPDGLRWRFLSDQPIIAKGEHAGSRFDSQNVAFWDVTTRQYICFCRDVRRNYRAIRRSTSADFLHWTDPQWVEFGDTPDEHLYTSAAIAYPRAPHIYLAFPRRFVSFRRFPKGSPFPEAVSDQVFMSSRDQGQNWDRRFMEAFLRPGLDKDNWGDRNGTISFGLLQTSPEELSLYWVEHQRLPTCRVRRGTIRTDGFVSVNAPYAGGSFTTQPFTYTGQSLYLNYATSAAGSIQIDLLDAASGKPIAGFAKDDSLIYGDEVDGLVSWRGGSDIHYFQDRAVQLRFTMKDADVYSLQFR